MVLSFYVTLPITFNVGWVFSSCRVANTSNYC